MQARNAPLKNQHILQNWKIGYATAHDQCRLILILPKITIIVLMYYYSIMVFLCENNLIVQAHW